MAILESRLLPTKNRECSDDYCTFVGKNSQLTKVCMSVCMYVCMYVCLYVCVVALRLFLSSNLQLMETSKEMFRTHFRFWIEYWKSTAFCLWKNFAEQKKWPKWKRWHDDFSTNCTLLKPHQLWCLRVEKKKKTLVDYPANIDDMLTCVWASNFDSNLGESMTSAQSVVVVEGGDGLFSDVLQQ